MVVFLAVCCYIYSIAQLVKCLGQILRHDVGAKVFDDYGSDWRSSQRGGALKSAFKSILFFALGGVLMFFNI